MNIRKFLSEQKKLKKQIKITRMEINEFKKNKCLEGRDFTIRFFREYIKEIKYVMRRNRKDFLIGRYGKDSNGKNKN